MELSSGTTVCGRFELLREESPNSGVPVFGPTWAVLDTETGEPARACVLDASLLPTPTARAEFVRALAGLADLRDTSLVPQIFVGEDAEHVIVCYDPLQGAFALGDLYDGTGSFDLRQEAGRLARQLARALALLHARDRVHGMLACEAVFVGPRGPAAFQHGFAPLCARAELERRCKAFHLAGLAPEVLRGGPFNPAADVYAWGVALAQFVTSQRGEAALAAAEPAGLPTGLWSLIQASLSAEPGARPQGGGDLVRRLEALALGNDSLELPTSPIAPSTPPPTPAPEDRSEAPASKPPEPKLEPKLEARPEPKHEPKPDAKPAEPKHDRSGAPAGMSLPVTNLEDLLLTSPRRPATIPPGSLHAGDDKVPGRSASGMRRVHVLTEDAIVRRPPSGELTPPNEASDVIIGGTKADLEAASRAPTVRLEPAVTGDVVQAAQARRSAALAAASAAAPIEPPPPSAADDKPAAPPRAPDVPRVPPPVDEPKGGSGVLGWLVLLALVAGLLVWLLG